MRIAAWAELSAPSFEHVMSAAAGQSGDPRSILRRLCLYRVQTCFLALDGNNNLQGSFSGSASSRQEALERLAAFVPYAGLTYAAKRNFDFGSGQHRFVSGLSPAIRHRLITESEVVSAVLKAHSASAAEKFIQEVCWRSYWKGWLEQRPQVWADYLSDLAGARAQLSADDSLAVEVAAAERGEIGVACFDAWAKELSQTGYLHNHARMWFASIWIFTLKLPWVLGADFFYRHLLDGDPASNTLSWRWVAGLHTQGKTYLARADNIATYTEGRLTPSRDELAPLARPLIDGRTYVLTPLPPCDPLPKRARVVVLATEDDLSPETWALEQCEVAAVALFKPDAFSPAPSRIVRAFKICAMMDARARCAARWDKPLATVATAVELVALASAHQATAVVTSRVPVGYLRTELDHWIGQARTSGLPVLHIRRRWDQLFWPHASAGFFKLKERIPAVLDELRLSPKGTAA
jgi:deoxyribodipyrimidine photo-lyase